MAEVILIIESVARGDLCECCEFFAVNMIFCALNTIDVEIILKRGSKAFFKQTAKMLCAVLTSKCNLRGGDVLIEIAFHVITDLGHKIVHVGAVGGSDAAKGMLCDECIKANQF